MLTVPDQTEMLSAASHIPQSSWISESTFNRDEEKKQDVSLLSDFHRQLQNKLRV